MIVCSSIGSRIRVLGPTEEHVYTWLGGLGKFFACGPWFTVYGSLARPGHETGVQVFQLGSEGEARRAQRVPLRSLDIVPLHLLETNLDLQGRAHALAVR